MESSDEGGGGGADKGATFIEIETAAEGLESPEMFHIVKEIIGFVLYMHRQIPSVLQHLENEFHTMKEEYKSLEEAAPTPEELKPSNQRIRNWRKRELKQGIKRLEKLMSTISALLSSLQLALNEMSDIQGVTLVLGSSIARPQHVYQIVFPQEKSVVQGVNEHSKSRIAEGLARKAIRALLSAGAGSSCTGPTKTFLLVRSSSRFGPPLHFLPKRDLQISKKIVPFILLIKCKTQGQAAHDSYHISPAANPTCPVDSTVHDVIWFQCRHIFKGLACKNSTEC